MCSYDSSEDPLRYSRCLNIPYFSFFLSPTHPSPAHPDVHPCMCLGGGGNKLVLKVSKPKTGAKATLVHSCVPHSCAHTAASLQNLPEGLPCLGHSPLCVLSVCQKVGGWKRGLKECSPCSLSPSQALQCRVACSRRYRRKKPL